MAFGTFLLLLTLLVLILYIWFHCRYRYWKKKGVYSLNASFPFGHIADVFLGKMHLGIKLSEFYVQTKDRHKFIGLFLIHRRVLMINDVNLIKYVLVKDFNYFMDHGLQSPPRSDPLSHHLAAMTGLSWKNLRARLTPTFTSNKMKYMFTTMKDCASVVGKYLETEVEHSKILNMRNIFMSYGIDVIGSCAFGLEMNSFKYPNTEFKKMANRISKPTFIESIKQLLGFSAPFLIEKFNIRLTPMDIETFFIETVEKTIKYREENNVKRKDFLQLLIDMKNDENEENALTIPEITAQVFFFFIAGHETSASTGTNILYELAKNPDIQEKLFHEIDTKLKENNGEITYESLQNMEYLTNAIEETLRMYPPLSFLFRICVQDYTIPNTDIVIEKGTEVFIPIMAIQRDPEIFENPLQFNPDRFNSENKNQRNQFLSIPFGEGPRSCIGNRFGLMQLKSVTIEILSKYKISLCDQTEMDLKFEPRTFPMITFGNQYLCLTRRN